MEQSLPLSGTSVPCKVRTRQTIAAVLFVVWLVWNGLSMLGLHLFLLQGVLLSPVAGFVMQAIVGLFPLAGFALLIPGAANRATKTALVLLSVGNACLVLCAAGGALFLSSLEDAEITYEHIGLVHTCGGYVSLAYAVVSLFAFSVILRSNEIGRSVSSWIGLLLVEAMLMPANMLVFFSTSFLYMQPDEYAFGSVPGLVFRVVWQLLLIVAYVRFACCSAFSGDGAAAPKGSCSPLNKYMAGIVVASGITLAVLWVVFRFAAPWLRTL